MKAEYLPFNDKHSIQEAQISILFLGSFDRQAIEVSRGVTHAELSEELPQATEVRGGSLRINLFDTPASPPLTTMQSDLVGFEFSKVQGTGKRARVLQLADNTLSVSFMDYDSWQAARKDALKYLLTVLTSVPLSQNPVVAFSLRFIDRYTFSGNPKEARAALLFAGATPHLTSNTFNAGPNWHCNTGWFDTTTGVDRVLHNLNVASSLIDLSSTVTINHHATRYLTTPRQSAETLLTPPDESTSLPNVLDNLHDQNKAVLGQLLLPEMLSKIGIAS